MDSRQKIARSLARVIGWMRLRSRSRWVPPLGSFVLVIVLVGTADYLLGKIPLQPFIELNKDWNHKFGDWLNIWTILAIYTITWLLIWSVQARSRMVVEKLVNYAGKELDEAVDGASMILLAKLGQLHDLY